MKKYKHKVTGYIVEQTNSEKNYKVSEPRHFTIPKWIIECSEDWEEIKEPEFEILTVIAHTMGHVWSEPCKVKRLSDNVIFELGDNTNNGIIEKFEESGDMLRVYFEGKKAYNINLNTLRHIKLDYEILESVRRTVVSSEGISPEKTVITSIKRLSDGEIFSIGDNVIRNNKTVKLETIDKDDMWLGGIVINDKTVPYGGECLNTLKKAKNPLFTTEDGVDIFEGDKYFYINSVKTNYNIFNANAYMGWSGDTNFIYFSTKEAAQEYVELNKPKYSKQQILDLLEELDEHTFSYGYVLTKERLKL